MYLTWQVVSYSGFGSTCQEAELRAAIMLGRERCAARNDKGGWDILHDIPTPLPMPPRMCNDYGVFPLDDKAIYHHDRDRTGPPGPLTLWHPG
jgi:hypothetical protein